MVDFSHIEKWKSNSLGNRPKTHRPISRASKKQVPFTNSHNNRSMAHCFFDIDKLHMQEIENRRDKKLNSKITSLFYSTLICIIFALVIFFNIKSYDLTSGFRLLMTIFMIIFIILAPILAVKMLILYFKFKRHRKILGRHRKR